MRFDYPLRISIMGISIALVQIAPCIALSPQEVGKIAKQIAVRIDSGSDRGSGVIINREGNTYRVLTAKHVIFKEKNTYTIITPDGDRHRVNYSTVFKLPDVDLAVVEFISPKNYFNISIPENAGESLKQVTLTQVEGEDIKYQFEETEAFEGTHRDRGSDLKPIEVTNSPETRTVSITFSSPIPPGKTVTVGLSPTRNPMDGVYLFKVRVFPQGENPQALDLGVGRLSFYNR